ncbi:MAG: damage-control phosphatase ARMT1 family protein [Candidatus Promineifilaceae bacterium]
MSKSNPSVKRPPDPIPAPLRASEIGTYTHTSVVKRLPDIGRQTLADNDFSPETTANLEALINGIPDDPIRYLIDTEAPDTADWAAYIAPYEGQNWLDIPWFFAEVYFYRRVLEATGYFVPQSPYYGRDPFARQKEQALDLGKEDIRTLIERIDNLLTFGGIKLADGLLHLLSVALWGNQADLSLWPAGQDGQPQHDDHDQQKAHVLADDSAQIVDFFQQQQGRQVDVVLDNAGVELVCDMCLTDFLLFSGQAASVRWHMKTHPTFVSDATIHNVYQTIDWLKNSTLPILFDMGHRLQAYLDWGRWELVDHPFWTSPLPMWQLTADLAEQLSQADLIITKGDANYRRLLGDRHWPFTTPFSEIVSYAPAPLLALRTLKSEIAAGITADKIKLAQEEDPDWLIDGRWGLIQFNLSTNQPIQETEEF